MARRRVLVRRLPALETLSAVSVVCTDKTGTLTENRMTVRATWTPWSEAPLLGPSAPDAVRRLFAAAALCTDAVLLARRQALATGLPPPRPGAGGDMHGRIPRHVWWAAGVDLEGLRAAAPALLHHAADPTTTAIQARATTAALAAIVACQMANLFACRSERLSAFALRIRGTLLAAGLAVEGLLLAAVMLLSPLQRVFQTAPLAPAAWTFILLGPATLLLVDEGLKRWDRLRAPRGRVRAAREALPTRARGGCNRPPEPPCARS